MLPEKTHLSIKNIGSASVSPIVTVTLNPALDRTMWVPRFEAGGTFQVARSETVAGGKGANASRALRRLGIGSTVAGVIGRGGSESYIARLEAEGLAHDFVLVDGALRTNVTILSEEDQARGEEAPAGDRGAETHLRERGPAVTQAALEELEGKLERLLRGPAAPRARPGEGADGTRAARSARASIGPPFVVLAGSLPSGLPPDSYARLVDFARSLGARAALDTSGEPLRLGLAAKPYMIKPNGREVEESLGFFPGSNADILRAVDLFAEAGIEAAVVSLGKDGLVYARGGSVFHARVAVERPVNAVGSGDAALAGAIAGELSGFSPEVTARLACATGAANTLISGACVFRLEDVERLAAAAEVKALR